MNKELCFSIVVPFFNEEGNVAILVERIDRELAALNQEFEIICVDDGSSDSTFNVLREIAEVYQSVKVIKLRRNFGQTPAMVAGIEFASGKVVITMDGDLQNDPADIPRLLSKLDEGYDIVVGWRRNRKDKLISRKIPSMIANRLIGKVTGVPIKDNGCSLKVYKAEVIKNVPLYSEMHRFIPAMAQLVGSRIAEVDVRHHPRIHGVSKYSLSRIYKVLLDLITIKMIASFKGRPFVWFAYISAPFLVLGVVILAVGIFIIHDGNPISIVGTGLLSLALSGFLLLSGALAELIYRAGDQDVKRLSFTTVSKLISENSYKIKNELL